MVFDKLDLPGTFIFGTSDGQVKQSAYTDYQPGSRYKSHASVAVKLKRPSARVVSVDYYEPVDENRSLLAISREGYAVRFDVADVPVTGIRTAGVRAINLKEGDTLVDLALVSDGQRIASITQRGAFKEMPIDEIAVGARARRGELVLHRLKSHPHQVADFLAYDADFTGHFEIITDRPLFQEVAVTDHHLGSIKSNGTFVIDTETQGTPVKIRLKLAEPLNAPTQQSLLNN